MYRPLIPSLVLALSAATTVAGAQGVDGAPVSSEPVLTSTAPRYHLALYGWLSGVDGTLVIDGTETPFEIPVEEIFEQLSGALMLYAEGNWGKWFGAFDGTWAQLTSTNEGLIANTEVRFDQNIYDLRVGREVYRRDLSDPTSRTDDWPREFGTDLFLGARYISTETNIDIIPMPGTPTNLNFKDERWDGFLGARARWDLSKRWVVSGRGDIGGFGIGESAEFTWQLEGIVGYRMSRWSEILLGYRALYFETVDGEDAARNGIELLQHGLIVGVGFGF